MSFTAILGLLISSILINNYIFSRFLGICPFLGLSGKTSTAVGMGLAVTFVMTVSTAVTWCVSVSYTHLYAYFCYHSIVDFTISGGNHYVKTSRLSDR